MNRLVWTATVVWASPWTLVGLIVGLVGLLSGGGFRRRGRVLEFWGGATTWLLRNAALPPGGAAAMTLGHVVLGVSARELDSCRDHELVHVRQYERWGPFFVPAYLLCWLVLALRRRDAYRDNPFEREAYETT